MNLEIKYNVERNPVLELLVDGNVWEKILCIGDPHLGTYYATQYVSKQYVASGVTQHNVMYGWATSDTYNETFPGTSYATYGIFVSEPLLLSTDTSLTLTLDIAANQGGGYTVYIQNVYLKWY